MGATAESSAWDSRHEGRHRRHARYQLCPGCLDTRWYSQLGIPAFGFGPGRFDISHGPNEHVGEAAMRRYVEEEFSPQRMMNDYIQVFETAIERAEAPATAKPRRPTSRASGRARAKR